MRIRRQKPEERIHVKIVAELRRAGVHFWHTPNESKATAAYRAKLKALGLSSGVPDLIIVTPPPCGGFVGAALELKAEKGRLSDTQKEWLQTLSGYGWATACTKGYQESIDILIEWGYLRPDTRRTMVGPDSDGE